MTVKIDADRENQSTNEASREESAATGEPSSATTNKGTIGYSALKLPNPFFKVIADNLKAEAPRDGYEVIVDDANRDVKAQSERLVRGMTAQQVADLLEYLSSPK